MKKNLAMHASHRGVLLPWALSVAVTGTLTIAQYASAAQPVNVDHRRSLVVTEQTILARFPLQRVLDQLVAQSGVPGLTSLDLFHQWWDTQNARNSPGHGPGPIFCDDTVDATGTPVINDFPYTCRPAPAEGVQASADPFTAPDTNPDAYIPIGLFNRFDVAAADGSHCGEHRIVYAKRSGLVDQRQRNLLIFEAALPNPHPRDKLKGCKKIAKFWADLTQVDDINERADRLEDFYFDGIANVPPVVHVDHYGGGPNGSGQVRTNQFLNAPSWSLREFKLLRTCSGGSCTAMQFVPVTDKTNPFGPLFQPAATSHMKAAAFQLFFPGQVKALAATTLTGIDFQVPDNFNTGQSQASSSTENNYFEQFTRNDSTLRADIQEQLPKGSSLTPDQIVLRAQALSCAGCHRLNNAADLGGGLVWPNSLGFTHVTERETEIVDGHVGFRISDALLTEFLPHRRLVLEEYLNDKPIKNKKPKDPIGGRRVH